MSPGVSHRMGTVRNINQPQETFHNGEILCAAVVTGPALDTIIRNCPLVLFKKIIGSVAQHATVHCVHGNTENPLFFKH